jgi:hypothetical protein
MVHLDYSKGLGLLAGCSKPFQLVPFAAIPFACTLHTRACYKYLQAKDNLENSNDARVSASGQHYPWHNLVFLTYGVRDKTQVGDDSRNIQFERRIPSTWNCPNFNPVVYLLFSFHRIGQSHLLLLR